MMLQALPLVHFWSVFLLKEQMMTSLRKICLENNHKIGRFWPIAFWWSLPRKPPYVAKNWALAMMLQALPLVHFWSVFLLKEQMMTSLRKICLENYHEIGRFFHEFVPKNLAKNGTFSSVYLEPMTTRFIMQTLICVISMEFLSLSRRHSSARNVPAVTSAEKQMFSQAKVDCVAYKLKLSWKLQFLWWKTCPYDGFEISKFCGGAQS